MKRFVFFIMLIIGLLAQAQVPVITLNQRLPNLYYWDTNWVDSIHAKYPEARLWSIATMTKDAVRRNKEMSRTSLATGRTFCTPLYT